MNPWRVGVLVLFFLLGVYLMIQAHFEADKWKESPVTFLGNSEVDADGLSPAELSEVVSNQTSGSANFYRWRSGGLVSLMVLDERLNRGEWWRALAMARRLSSAEPDSSVGSRARLVASLLESGLSLIGLALLGGLFYWRRSA